MPTTRTSHTASSVRRRFLDFFVERGHTEVPSGPVFPQDDPTLLFTNAGMNQFKDVFLGTGTRDYARPVDTQKCIRVSGKHNDLEEVGRDTYHHTFFEMLGNWSFGDYFKEEAIVWAWELLTEVWKLPKERLWATVFGGDAEDGLPADEEAERIWREKTDIDPAHILRFGKRDNFWEMGETGPCGPCSEIHIDRGSPGDDPSDGADPSIGVNAGNERFIELWNLVFMQFNRQDDGSLVPLAAKGVDTGMGFERILSVLQGRSSNYDTDLFTPLFARIEELTGKRYGSEDEEANVAFRVCADHMRACACAFADGALPSNEGRGYVLRRLIRRAARFGRQALGMQEPFLSEIVPAVAEVLGDAFPEIRQRLDHIRLLVRSEEESFRKTLDRGLVLFENLAGMIEKSGSRTLPGDRAYELYATYGFPRDLVELMARERGLDVDQEGWDEAERAHREVSKSEGKFKQLLSAEQQNAVIEGSRELLAGGPVVERSSGVPATVSTYHSEDASYRKVTRVVRLFAGGDGPARLVLLESPFYAEGGGQVGDAGHVHSEDGSFRFEVSDTQRVGGIVVHLGKVESGSASPGLAVVAEVDRERRDRTRRNHTATHFLHKALRDQLGDHVTQQGSYVGPDRLRFDLSHPRGITPEELDAIERQVNAAILANHRVITREEDLEEAKARGVMALFGEKYDQRVRVVDAGSGSLELCGGTHVAASGDIGPFLIVAERAIQAGVRRIEALTGSAALEEIQHQRRLLRGTAAALKTAAEEVPERVEQLQKQLKEAKKKQKASAGADVGALFGKIKKELSERGGVLSGVVDCPELDGASLRELGERLGSLGPDLCVVVLGRDGGRVPFLIVCRGAALGRGLKAGALAKQLASRIGGGGGGRPELAQGQGTSAEDLPRALAELGDSLAAALER